MTNELVALTLTSDAVEELRADTVLAATALEHDVEGAAAFAARLLQERYDWRERAEALRVKIQEAEIVKAERSKFGIVEGKEGGDG